MDRRRRGLEVDFVARVREVRARVCGLLVGDLGDRFWKTMRRGVARGVICTDVCVEQRRAP
jgi:hypothetical protein